MPGHSEREFRGEAVSFCSSCSVPYVSWGSRQGQTSGTPSHYLARNVLSQHLFNFYSSSSLGKTLGNHPTCTKSTTSLPSPFVVTSTPSLLSTAACLAAPPESSLSPIISPFAPSLSFPNKAAYRRGTVPFAEITRCHGTFPAWYVFSPAVEAGGRCFRVWPTCRGHCATRVRSNSVVWGRAAYVSRLGARCGHRL
jgi:hypothetical protein